MNHIRAAWLALRIWTPALALRYDASEPFGAITWAMAWEVARGIWLKEKA